VPDRTLADRITAISCEMVAAVRQQDPESVARLVHRQEHLIVQARSAAADCQWSSDQLSQAISACQAALEYLSAEHASVRDQLSSSRKWRTGLENYAVRNVDDCMVLRRC